MSVSKLLENYEFHKDVTDQNADKPNTTTNTSVRATAAVTIPKATRTPFGLFRPPNLCAAKMKVWAKKKGR